MINYLIGERVRSKRPFLPPAASSGVFISFRGERAVPVRLMLMQIGLEYLGRETIRLTVDPGGPLKRTPSSATVLPVVITRSIRKKRNRHFTKR